MRGLESSRTTVRSTSRRTSRHSSASQGMTHVRTAPYYPQSNGKTERWHKTIKSDALRPASPTSLEEARRLMERFVKYYNGVRLHSAIGYIAPLDFMDGKATQIWSERDRKLEQARKLRRERGANKVPA